MTKKSQLFVERGRKVSASWESENQSSSIICKYVEDSPLDCPMHSPSQKNKSSGAERQETALCFVAETGVRECVYCVG